MKWEDFTVKEDERTETPCDCCASTTTELSGNLLHKNTYHSWHTARWSDAHLDIPMLITVYTGDWDKNAAQNSRWATRIAVPFGNDAGCSLMGWSDEDLARIYMFTPLNRNDILDTDYAPQLWASVDAILMKDRRLEHM